MTSIHLNKTKAYAAFDLTSKNTPQAKQIFSKSNEQQDLVNAENRILDLEKRLTTIEQKHTSSSPSHTQTTEVALKAYQKQVLSRLQTIKQTLIDELGSNSSSNNNNNNNNSDIIAENNKLKEDIKALNYRIQILIKALNEEELKHK